MLEKGDIVFVEPVPYFRGYTARLMRPKVIGAPTDEQIRTAETMIRIQDEQFRTMRPAYIQGTLTASCAKGCWRLDCATATPVSLVIRSPSSASSHQ
ncbi:hypothetical protein [Phyllobacterium zundukense]|uniref:hypothetical protein n=1 Tax=Phyllobacterium zundukense TaxID=1867719 RepID=UPI003965AC56